MSSELFDDHIRDDLLESIRKIMDKDIVWESKSVPEWDRSPLELYDDDGW